MLLDIGLPGMSGLDVLTEVQNLAAPPRVVMITADDTSETLLKAVRGQADRYVTKPFAPGAIVEVVEDVLDGPPAAALPIQVVSATTRLGRDRRALFASGVEPHSGFHEEAGRRSTGVGA